MLACMSRTVGGVELHKLASRRAPVVHLPIREMHMMRPQWACNQVGLLLGLMLHVHASCCMHRGRSGSAAIPWPLQSRTMRVPQAAVPP